MMDGYFRQIDALGAVLTITADHGMNAKHDKRGAPDVIYLQTLLDGWLGAGAAKVILPITDPYVVHHGALGSFATVYLANGAGRDGLIARLRRLDGILAVYSGPDGCREFELPEDRMGDVIVVSGKHKTIGTSADRHDLSQLREPLRSHGGITEQKVPLVVAGPLSGLAKGRRFRNFDAFDLALNHAQ
jgi:phosphonoacetate hydrolase